MHAPTVFPYTKGCFAKSWYLGITRSCYDLILRCSSANTPDTRDDHLPALKYAIPCTPPTRTPCYAPKGINFGNQAALRLTLDMRQSLGKEGTKQFIKDSKNKKCSNCVGFWCTSFTGFRRKTHPFGARRGYCCCH